jgi:Restriction endonuclease
MDFSERRAYQVATAEVFRRLGYEVKIEYLAQGARAQHRVDVYATFFRSGILCTWIVECKLWNKRVPKEKVMALKGIVSLARQWAGKSRGLRRKARRPLRKDSQEKSLLESNFPCEIDLQFEFRYF